MMSRAAVLILFVLFGYIAVCVLRHPAPPGTGSVKVKFSSWLMITLWDAAHVLADYGLCDRVEGIRFISDKLFRRSQNQVKEEWTAFDGVPVKMFFPNKKTEGRPGLVYYHGGGWTQGRADSVDPSMARLAEELGAVVVSVDYPCRPEASIDELYEASIKAALFFIQNAHQWHVNPNRVALGGGSAGANIATVVCLHMRDIGFHPMPRLQVLLTGCFQVLDQTLPAYQQNLDGPIMHEYSIYFLIGNFIFGRDLPKHMKVFKEQRHVPLAVRQQYHSILNHDIIPKEHKYPPYNPVQFREADLEVWNKYKDVILHPYVSPLLVANHSGLPEAYVVSSQYDMVRDDSFLYAKKLREAGVTVTHYNDPVGFHSNMLAWQLTQEADYAMTTLIDFIKSTL